MREESVQWSALRDSLRITDICWLSSFSISPRRNREGEWTDFLRTRTRAGGYPIRTSGRIRTMISAAGSSIILCSASRIAGHRGIL